jgi:triosephosphate isomerase
MKTKIEYPFIIVNLKTYKESLGPKAVVLGKIAEEVSIETGVCVAIAPQNIDLIRVIDEVDIPVFAQHIDPVNYGKFTGHILPEAMAEAGCSGTLINHSEKQLAIDVIEATVKRAKEVNLFQVVCVDSVETGCLVAPFSPDVIAIEPPELIGSGISVSLAKPEVVSGSVTQCKSVNPKVKVLCGAGITDGKDAAAALKLGSSGVLVASGVVKASDPKAKLMDLASSMIN